MAQKKCNKPCFLWTQRSGGRPFPASRSLCLTSMSIATVTGKGHLDKNWLIRLREIRFYLKTQNHNVESGRFYKFKKAQFNIIQSFPVLNLRPGDMTRLSVTSCYLSHLPKISLLPLTYFALTCYLKKYKQTAGSQKVASVSVFKDWLILIPCCLFHYVRVIFLATNFLGMNSYFRVVRFLNPREGIQGSLWFWI